MGVGGGAACGRSVTAQRINVGPHRSLQRDLPGMLIPHLLSSSRGHPLSRSAGLLEDDETSDVRACL